MNLNNFYRILKEAERYNARLIVVTKNRELEDIRKVYATGHKIFGENKVQELIRKSDALPADIQWHLIGSLQKNKVRQIIPRVIMIQSVDSFELAKKIHQEAAGIDRRVAVLLEIKIATEKSKHGFIPADLIKSLSEEDWKSLDHIQIQGLMGMATYTSDHHQIRTEFKNLIALFNILKKEYFPTPVFRELSFGMSEDYLIALEEGATMIRVGSKVFAEITETQ